MHPGGWSESDGLRLYTVGFAIGVTMAALPHQRLCLFHSLRELILKSSVYIVCTHTYKRAAMLYDCL